MIHSSTTNLCSQYDPARTDDSKVENVLLTYLINSTLINNDIFNIVTLGTIYLICAVRKTLKALISNASKDII